MNHLKFKYSWEVERISVGSALNIQNFRIERFFPKFWLQNLNFKHNWLKRKYAHLASATFNALTL